MLATTVMMLALYLGQGISPTVLGWFDGPGARPGMGIRVMRCFHTADRTEGDHPPGKRDGIGMEPV